ncbi:MAG: methionyl-tRNA formyltransferase [Caldicoprobacterales bacterium]
MRIIFMGTPEFALPSLEAIYNSGHELIAVVTQPDRPKGRGKRLTPPPVKSWALERNIAVYQPLKIRNNNIFIEEIKKLNPYLVVTAAFGQILPKEFLEIPALGCINVHSSLLPEYRGASPIQQALIDGKEKTGITIIYMDEGMDTGDIILQKEIDIQPSENAGQLHDRLADLGAELLTEAISLFEKGKPKGIPQNHDKATYCRKIDKSLGQINWADTAYKIKNLIRGLTPWPGCFTFIHGKRLKVWKVYEREYFTNEKTLPGTVLRADETNGLLVACGKGVLRLEQLQGEGGKVMSDLEFLRGNKVTAGIRLGKTE